MAVTRSFSSSDSKSHENTLAPACADLLRADRGHAGRRIEARRYALTLLAGVVGLAGAAEPPPVSAFAASPRFDHASISMAGTHFAVSWHDGPAATLKVFTYPEGEVKLDLSLPNGVRVTGGHWLSDGALVFATDGGPNNLSGSCDACGGTARRQLWTLDTTRRRHRKLSRGTVVDMIPGEPRQVLVDDGDGVYRWDRHGRHLIARPSEAGYRNAYRFPTRLGALDGYVVDRAARVVFNVATNDAFDQTVFRRIRDNWELVATSRLGDGWVPLGAGPADGSWYVLDGSEAATAGLALLYDADGRRERLAGHPKVDVSRVLFAGRRAYGVQFEPDYPSMRYVEPDHPLARAHRELSALFPRQRVTIASFTADYKRALAVVEGDRMPGELVLTDADAGGFERLMGRRPSLEPSMLASMTPVEFTARDGATVHAYVTVRPEVPRPRPTVVLVHDGPHGVRDVWGFDALAQLLASHGYQILQVNYRGSGGYGHEYARRGVGEWGGLMQDDVTDATRWAVETGMADAGRICILGTGYGAYAALMGTVREPNTYRCAIGVSGVYDLEAAAKGRGFNDRHVGLRQVLDKVGRSGLRELSPAHRAGRIDVPVLLAHGTRDARSPYAQARGMRAALARTGNAVEWVPLKRQGHTLSDPNVRRDLYERILAFLRRQLTTG